MESIHRYLLSSVPPCKYLVVNFIILATGRCQFNETRKTIDVSLFAGLIIRFNSMSRSET